MNRLKQIVIAWVTIAVLSACGDSPDKTEDVTRKRGNDPWVMRLMLDNHTGMIAAALDPKLWVAYDTRKGSLYGAWSQGVHFYGAVYDQIHGPQPLSADPPLLMNPVTEPWHVVRNGEDLRPVVRYRGHRIEKGQVYLMYSLVLPDRTSIDVDERPEAVKSPDGSLALERTFWIAQQPAATQVALDFQAVALESETDIKISERGSALTGQLELRASGPTRIVMQFAPPAPPKPPGTPQQAEAEKLIAQTDCGACHNATVKTVGPSYTEIAEHYKTNDQVIAGLSRKIIEGGSGVWGESWMADHPKITAEEATEIARYILTNFDPQDAKGTVVTHPILQQSDAAYEPEEDGSEQDAWTRGPGGPGDRARLTDVHPSFTLATLHPASFKPMVGGLDVLPDGRVLLSTWDPRGSVFVVGNLDAKSPEEITVKEIAAGLQEPLGLKVVDGVPYVMQKHELTKLVDNNDDDIIDEFLNVTNGWQTTGNFHEFAFGLEYIDGHFFGTLATAILPGGASAQPQVPDRGRVIRIDKATGAIDFYGQGLRTPNGIGVGIDKQLFVADNQGDWLPASKLMLVEKDAFYGSHSVDPVGTKDLKPVQPLAWLPQDDVSNSPTQPAALNVGPFKNQMIYGDVYYGGLNRVIPQQIDGRYQACVVPFSQGLEAGVNRTIVGPDGAIYVGGIGNPGNWGQDGKQWFGLQRLKYNGTPTFEMLDVQLRSDGVELTLTEPLRPGDGVRSADYEVKQWRYVPTAAYGGPKVDERALAVRSVHLSSDRRKVFLEVTGIKTDHVLYVRLAQPPIADSGREIWATETWCTINAIPKDSKGERSGQNALVANNSLTDAEKTAGWRSLFDGKTTKGWHNFQGKGVKSGWAVINGELRLAPGGDGGDIVTDEEFGDFELDLEWQIAKAGNSGIFYRAIDSAKEIWNASPEMQVLDNALAEDRVEPTHRAGAAYDLYVAKEGIVRPPGEFNRARIVARGTRVEHWLNGHKVVEFDTSSADWKAKIAKSKFNEFPEFAKAPRGRIGLQDHGDGIRFRNIKIMPL